MKRLLMIVTILTMILGCGGASKMPARSPTARTSHMGKSTVALVFTDEDKEVIPFCSGVWISEQEILTAGHCAAAIAKKVKDLPDIEGLEIDPVDTPVHFIVQDEVTSVGKEPSGMHLAKVTSYDGPHDLALLHAEGKLIPPHESAELASELPAVGERIFIVGHPKGMYWTFIEGVVSSYREDLPTDTKKGPYVQISAPVWFGNSGGGAFDSRGDLVGIASFITRAPNTSFFVHPEAINKFLKTVKEREAKRADLKILEK